LNAEWGKRCELTGAISFADAIERVLADPNVAARVEKIAVSRPVAAARIEYRDHAVRRDGDGLSEQKFGSAPAALSWVESFLDGGAAHKIATDLREIEAETGVGTP
jgi:hypothetical protein